MRSYDFTPLSATTSSTEVKNSFSAVFEGKKWLSALAGVGVVGSVGLSIFVLALLSFVFGEGEGASMMASLLAVVGNAGITLAVVAGIGALLYTSSLANKKRLLRLQRFAEVNQLAFRYNIAPTGLKGLIFDNGYERTIREVLAFPDGFEVGNYRFITGSGKNRRVHDYGYVRVQLGRNMPNMVLDGKKSNFMGLTNLPDVFHSSQKLRLEGNFSDYFDLYVPKQYEADALYVFTPDVMQALIDNGQAFDLEVVDNELYVYIPSGVDLASEVRIKQILESVDSIVSELRSQTNRYRDDRAQAASAQVVSQEGRRLKRGANWTLLLVVLAVVGFDIVFTFLPSGYSGVPGFLYSAVFWVVVIFAFSRYIKRRR